MVEQIKQYCQYEQQHRLPPLFVAVDNGLPWCTYFLLSKCDVDVNEVCGGTTPLNRAIIRNHVTIVKLLLSHPGIKLNRQKNALYGPLHIAAVCQNSIFFQLLLRHHQMDDINEKDFMGRSCFMTACSVGNTSALELLYSSSWKTKLQTDLYCEGSKRTASHLACAFGSFSVIEFLMRHGLFQPNVTTSSGETPIDLAIETGQLNIVKLLFDKGIYTVVTHDMMLHSSSKGYVAMTEFLLKSTRLCVPLSVLEEAIGRNNVKVAMVVTDELNNQILRLYNKDDFKMITVVLILNAWNPHAEIPKGLLFLWRQIESKINMKNKTPLVDCNDIFSNMIKQPLVENGISLRYETELYVLYYLILYGHEQELMNLLSNKSVGEIKNNVEMHIQGIKLRHLAIKNPKILNIFRDKNVEFEMESESETFDFWYNLQRFRSGDVDYKTDRQLRSLTSKGIGQFVKRYMDKNLSIVISEFTQIAFINHLYTGCPEIDSVFETIASFMKAVGSEIEKDSPQFGFTPIQVGSSVEGTRPYFPDEFDFLLHCQNVEKMLQITSDDILDNKVTVELKPGFDLTELSDSINEKTGPACWLKDHIDKLLKNAIPKVFTDGKFMDNLYLDPNFFEKKEISCIYLNWRGDELKDMKIKIDLVPCFEDVEFKPLQKYVDSPCRYFVFCKTLQCGDMVDAQIRCSVAFSDVERKLIESVPKAAREGLKLAKAMRITRLFPVEILDQLQEVFHLEDCMKTYMIKTSLFICYKSNENDMTHLKYDEWAYMIYCYIQMRLLFRGGIPSIFSLTARGESVMLSYCEDPLDIPIEHQRKCCINRRNLLLIATQLTTLLDIHLWMTARDGMITQLQKYAKKAANMHPRDLFPIL